MNISDLSSYITETWERSIIPTLCDFVRIPNKSPLFDPAWEAHGYMDSAAVLLADWCKRQPTKGWTAEIARLRDRTPLLFFEFPGRSPETAFTSAPFDKHTSSPGC